VGIPAPADDRVALVTGASSGIGEAIALELARRGHQLVLVARRTDRLHALAGSVSQKAHVLAADLSRPAERAALPGRVAELGLKPDILVNNAGLSVGASIVKSTPEQQLTWLRSTSQPWWTSVADSCREWSSVVAARC
jgi:short-subunit dehydrogenase